MGAMTQQFSEAELRDMASHIAGLPGTMVTIQGNLLR